MAFNKSTTRTVAKVANAAKNSPNLSKISSFSSPTKVGFPFYSEPTRRANHAG